MRSGLLTAICKKAGGLAPLLLLAASTFAGKVAVGLSFYDEVLVNDTVFTVGDIARVNCSDVAVGESVRNRIAGTCAPPGYGRFLSSADFVALRLASAFHEVAFSVSGSARPNIRTDYRVVTVGRYDTEIRSYLDTAVGWQPGDWAVSIANGTDSCKCLNMPVAVSVSGLRGSFPKGNENITLQLLQGSRTLRLTVRCRFSIQSRVVVAKGEISRGQVLSAADVEIRRMDLTRFAPSPYSSPDDLRNMRAARTIRPGTILHDRLVLKIPVVEKGEPVSIVYTKGRVSIAVSGVARESGGKGDRIWVENLNTHKLLRVEIKEKGKVHALQGGVSI